MQHLKVCLLEGHVGVVRAFRLHMKHLWARNSRSILTDKVPHGIFDVRVEGICNGDLNTSVVVGGPTAALKAA